MKPSPAEAEPASHRIYEVSDFTRELIDDVARDRYRPGAWWELLSRSWDRSLEDLREAPPRARSALRWTILGAAIGAGVILLALAVPPSRATIGAVLLWPLWYAAVVFFLFTHLGMVDGPGGRPHERLLLPNGLSFLRLGLAPLVLWPCLSQPIHAVTAPVYAGLVVGLAVTDGMDGWLARRLGAETRMGRMLDPLADLALVTFLAVGLTRVGLLPFPLVVLLIVRYPVVLLVVVVLYFVRGPAPLRPTAIGKATFLVVNVVLVTASLVLLLRLPWPTSREVGWAMDSLYLVVGAGLLHLTYRGITWGENPDGVNSKVLGGERD